MTRIAAPAPALCPEFAFLLHATRWPHDDDAVAAIREAVCHVAEPDRLRALTHRHHAAGFVARALGRCEGLLGAELAGLRRDLRREAMALAEEQFRQLLQTRQAVEALRGATIPVLVLKGAPAALGLYGEAGVRTSIDIDLLIARADLDHARDVLAGIGYDRSEPPAHACARQLAAIARYGKDWAFDHASSDTGIELHWRLFQNPRLLGGVGVGEAVEAHVAPGIALPVLPPAIAALYMVAHGAEHAWSRLKWLADLATLLRRDPATADRLVAGAQAHGIAPMAMAALMLCHRLYATPLPHAQHAGLAKAWRTRMLVDIAWASLVGEQDGVELEDRAMATTRKNLGHYLFRADPRYWWREAGYDLFHDAGSQALSAHLPRRLIRRLSNVIRLPSHRTASHPA